MGSQPPASQDLGEDATAVVAAARGESVCKRRKKLHVGPGTAAGAAAPASGEDLDAAQSDWWMPQPRATLDPNEYQDRPYEPLARSFSCALCAGLLQEPITALECGHTYCYDCIERRVEIGGNHNVCPVAGCGAVLGPNPFDHHRLMYDTLLDTLVQKIFPRPDLDAALSARRAEREAATREARAEVNGDHRHHEKKTGHHHQQHKHPGTLRQYHDHHQQLEQQQQQKHRRGQGRVQQQDSPQQSKHRSASSPGRRVSGPAAAGAGRGGSSSDGGEGDDEGSDEEPRGPAHATRSRAAAAARAAH